MTAPIYLGRAKLTDAEKRMDAARRERTRLIEEAEEVAALIEDDIPAVSDAGMNDLIYRLRQDPTLAALAAEMEALRDRTFN